MYQINLTLFILFSILKNNFHYFFIHFLLISWIVKHYIIYFFYKVINKGGININFRITYLLLACLLINDIYQTRKLKEIENDIEELENEDIKSVLKLNFKLNKLLYKNLFNIAGILFLIVFFVAKQVDLL